MRNKTGPVVRGDDFFKREKLVNQLWKRIFNGNHILLTAPRRAGKTSLLRHLEDFPQEGYLFLYLLVQSAENKQEYYKRIIEKLYSSEFLGKLKKAGNLAIRLWNVFKDNIEEVEGLKFKSTEKQITLGDIEKLLENLNLNCKLVLVIDEFPDVVKSILEKEGKDQAEQFLKDNRILCENGNINEKVQFIFTGSIGLDNLVQKISSSSLINSLTPLTVSPMSIEEGEALLNKLLEGENVTFRLEKEQRLHFLQRVDWLMPFYIQLFFQEVDDFSSEKGIDSPTKDDLDQAFQNLFSHHNRKNFAHWEERLSHFSKIEHSFVLECLNRIIEQREMSKKEIFDLSQKSVYLNQIQEKILLNTLIHDGYIHETEISSQVFRFNSPILQEWWRCYVYSK